MSTRACLALMATMALPTPALAGEADCRDRDGRCITVRLNGQGSVKMSKQTKKKLEDLLRPGQATRWSGQLRHELPRPTQGQLQFDARPVPGSERWFGVGATPEAMLYPLDAVELQTRPELQSQGSVRAGGSALVTRADVLEQDRLPPGRYILSITLSGSDNWDRHLLYFEVEP